MKKLFSIFAALLFAGSIMASVGNLYYTLAISQTAADAGGNTSYDGSAEMTVGGMQWSLSGNTNLGDYWAIGGKSLTSKERATYSKTAMGDAIAKIVVSHSGVTADALKVDSAVLIVASDAAFSTVTDRIKLNPTVAKNTNGTVEFTPTGDKWAEDSFYKISFFLTNAKNSNYRMPITKIDFFSYLDPNAPSISASNIDLGLCLTKDGSYTKTVDLEVVGANLTQDITYTIHNEDKLQATGTLTKDGGTLHLTFTADAEGDYDFPIELNSGTDVILNINFTASVLTVSGLGEKEDPFSAADVVAINNRVPNTEKYWVKGYIVGCAANGGALADTDVATNLALGATVDQTANIIPVELPSGDIRTALNVVDNATNKGKQVKVYGQLVSYFSYTGVKSTSDYAFIEEAVETKYYLKNNWDGGEWSWKETTKDGVNYKLENVVFGGSGVNWNTAESDEGASWVALEAFEGDIIKALDTVNLILTPSTGAIYATLLGSYVAPATNTYTAAGSSAAIFGTAWDPTVEANDLTLKEGTTIYEKVYTDVTLAAGTVSFKVCVNHAWTTAYPASDYNLTIPEGGIYTVTITYDSSTNAVSATAEKTGSAVVIPTIKMHGTFDGSWADTEEFTMAADEQTASLVIALAVGDVEFGVKVDGAWTANGATLTREAPSTSLATGSGNMHLTADVAGNYTFTWTYATQTLAVEFPEAPVAGCDWDNIEFLGDGSAEQTFGSQFKVCVGDPAPNVVNIQTPGFAAATGIYVTFPSAAFGAISLANDQYVIDGAGMVMYLSAFTATETEVTVNCQSVDYIFTVYNAKGIATAIVNNTVEEKAVKFIENGQLFIRKNGKTYNATGAVVK